MSLHHHTPTAEAISAVLRHADVREDLGGGRSLYRLSARRSRNRDIRRAAGGAAARLEDVAVLYDENEGEIVRVLASEPVADPAAADGRKRRFDENDDRWWAMPRRGVAN